MKKPSRITENRIMNGLKVMAFMMFMVSFLTTFWGTAKADTIQPKGSNKTITTHESCEGKFVKDASSSHGYLNQPFNNAYTIGRCE